MTQQHTTHAPGATLSRAVKQKSEINLSGAGNSWDLHFTSNENLSNAITFRRNIDDTDPGLPGIPNRTVSIFAINKSIRIRDTRSLTIQRRERHGAVKNLIIMLGASVDIDPDTFDIVRHEASGGDWLTLIRMKEGKRFRVQALPIIPNDPPRPLQLRFDMVKLWSQRLQIQDMRYMALVIRGYRDYVPWRVVLEKEIFGSVVRAATAFEDREMLIEWSSDEGPEGPSASGPAKLEIASVEDEAEMEEFAEAEAGAGAESYSEEEGVVAAAAAISGDEDEEADDIPDENESVAQGPVDPFRSVWQHAQAKPVSGKGKGKEREV